MTERPTPSVQVAAPLAASPRSARRLSQRPRRWESRSGVAVRGRAAVAALGLTALTVSGCGSGHHPAAASPPAAPAVTSSAPVPAGNAAGAAAVAAAIVAEEHLRSYTFASSERLNGTVSSTLTGRVVLPHAVAYTLLVRGVRTDAVQIGSATYARRAGGRWQRLTRATAAPQPLSQLIAVLRALRQPAAAGGTVSGQLSAADAQRLQFTGTALAAGDVPVLVGVDAEHRVTQLVVTVGLKFGTATPARLVALTTFARFNAAPPITRPV